MQTRTFCDYDQVSDDLHTTPNGMHYAQAKWKLITND